MVLGTVAATTTAVTKIRKNGRISGRAVVCVSMSVHTERVNVDGSIHPSVKRERERERERNDGGEIKGRMK